MLPPFITLALFPVNRQRNLFSQVAIAGEKRGAYFNTRSAFRARGHTTNPKLEIFNIQTRSTPSFSCCSRLAEPCAGRF